MRTLLLTITLCAFCALPAEADTSERRGLATLSRIESFSPFFELGQGAVRLVVIVSPVSRQAETTVDAVARLFASVHNNRLRAYVLLSPEKADIGSMEALELWRPVQDRRIIGFWDPKGIAREHWRSVVGMESRDWDAVFLYDTDVRFGATLETKPFWAEDPDIHDPVPPDVEALTSRVRELLDGFEKRTTADTTSQSTP